jgi:hypothetical protein
VFATEEIVKNATTLACLLALYNLTLFAQTASHPRTLHTTEKSAIRVPPQKVPKGLKKIYSNFDPRVSPYNTDDFWYVAGPNADIGGAPFFLALPFVPKSDSHVSEVRVAVQYSGSGANQVNLSIYEDASGNPGTLLAGPVTVTNLSEWPDCCTLTIADFTPTAVIAGNRYWVVADTPPTGTGSDFFGVWDATYKPWIPMAVAGGGNGWSVTNADSLIAGEVLGTIP